MRKVGWRLPVILQSILIIIASCYEDTWHRSGVSDDQYRRDTAYIHKSLKEVVERSFPSVDQALKNLDSAVNLADAINYEEIVPELILYQGNLKYVQNMYQEAMKLYENAIEIAGKRNDSLLIARCLERMASIQLATDAGLALKLYYQALSVFEKEHYEPGIAKVYNVLGVYKASLKQFDAAKDYLYKAIQINQKNNNKFYLIENKGNLAYVLEKKGDFEEAEIILNELIEELTLMNDSINLQYIYYNLALLVKKKGDINKSLLNLEKAIEIAEPVKDSMQLPALYGVKGDLYYGLGKMDSALIYLKKSARWAHAIGDHENEMKALSILMVIDSVQGNYREAYIKNRQILVLKDTIYQRQIRNSTKIAELTYENEKIRANLELQKLKELSANRQRLLYFVLSIVAFLAVGLLVIVLLLQRKNYRKNKKIIENELLIRDLEMNKAKQEQELTELRLEKAKEELIVKDRELVSIALSVEQKKEFLGIIRKKIKDSFQNGSQKESLTTFNNLLATIGMNLNESGESDLFNRRFSMIHENFFENLKNKHPQLTKSDLRFCAYLKIHLSGSQIANILNVTQEAIRKTRYRLRKKLNLSPTDSLEDYISGF